MATAHTVLRILIHTAGHKNLETLSKSSGISQTLLKKHLAGDYPLTPEHAIAWAKGLRQRVWVPPTPDPDAFNKGQPGYWEWEVRPSGTPEQMWEELAATRRRRLETLLKNLDSWDRSEARREMLLKAGATMLRMPEPTAGGFCCELIPDPDEEIPYAADEVPCGVVNCREHNPCPVCQQKPCTGNCPWKGDPE